MSQVSYRANLSATVFPMTLEKAGQSVIVPGPDNNFDRRIDPRGAQKDVGIPQAIYMENILPTPEGFQSVTVAPHVSAGATPNINILSEVNAAHAVSRVESLKVAFTSVVFTEAVDLSYTSDNSDYTGWQSTNSYQLYPTFSAAVPYAQGNVYLDWSYIQGIPAITNGLVLGYLNNPSVPVYTAIPFENFEASLDLTISYKGLAITPGIIEPTPPDTYKYGEISCVFLGYFQLIFTMGTAGGNGPPVAGDKKLHLRWHTGANLGAYTELAVSAEALIPVDYDKYYSFVIEFQRDLATDFCTVNARMINIATSATIASLIWTGPVPGNFVGSAGSGVGFYHVIDTDFLGQNSPTDPSQMGWAKTYASAYKDLVVTSDFEDSQYESVGDVRQIHLAMFPATTNNARYSEATSKAWQNGGVDFAVGTVFTAPASETDLFSSANVRGVCYVGLKVSGVFKVYKVFYQTANSRLLVTDITDQIKNTLGPSFEMNTINGLVGSFNYLCLLTTDGVLWSSTTNPTDFSSSLVSGAGGERVGNLRGEIRFAKEHIAGFIIYTTGNTLLAQYTGNPRYPWKFVEISASSGYTYPQQVAGDANFENQFGLSNAKVLQVISPGGAQVIAPEASNHLERDKHVTIYNSATDTFSKISERVSGTATILQASGAYKVWYMLDRYLICGYVQTGARYCEYALVYDTLLQRYGRLKHSFDQVVVSESIIYFITYGAPGLYQPLQFNAEETALPHKGILALGKFQLQRGKLLTLDEVVVEGIRDPEELGTTDVIRIIPSLDGITNLQAIAPHATDEASTYVCRSTCRNFMLVMKGTINTSCVTLKFHMEGNR